MGCSHPCWERIAISLYPIEKNVFNFNLRRELNCIQRITIHANSYNDKTLIYVSACGWGGLLGENGKSKNS